jgi:DNA-binding MarR family transcriptional regulator
VFDRLEKQELIARSPLPGGSRVRAAAATEQGAKVARQAETLVKDAHAFALVDLSAKEIDSLPAVLQRLAASESVGSAPPTGSCR